MDLIMAVCIIITTLAVILIAVYMTLTMIQMRRLNRRIQRNMEIMESASSKIMGISGILSSPLLKLLMVGLTAGMAAYGINKRKRKPKQGE
jgi:hypothetical protein